MKLETLIELGFDRSADGEDGYLKARCSACQALVVNGVPTHESRCPNIPRVDDDRDFDDDNFLPEHELF